MIRAADTRPDGSSSEESFEATLEALAALGVRLWEDGGQLRFRAPKGVMTAPRLEWLRAHKAALLEHLRALEREAAIVSDPARRHEPFPVTDVQAAYLLGRHSAFAYGGLACHGYLEVSTERLDPARLEAAWNALIARHDMLRAIVHPDGHQQVLERTELVSVKAVDVRGQSAPDRERALAATRDDMSHRVYPTERWPLHELRLTQLDEGSLVHLSIDLLVSDLLSMQRLLVELDQLYLGQTLPPLTLTFRDYVLATRTALVSGSGRAHRLERDRAYWWNRLDSLAPAPELPLRGGATAELARFRRLRMRLDKGRASALATRAGEHGLTYSNAVLSAYAEVVGRFSRREDFTLNLTMLGRQPLHAEVQKLVGDFTTVSLLSICRPAARSEERPFAEWALTVQDQLAADMDHQGFSGVEVIRELARRRGSAAALMPVVYTSALGLASEGLELDGPFGRGDLSDGVSQTPQVWIDCQVLSQRGELIVQWDVREGVLADGVVESMFEAFEDLLTRLATSNGPWREASPMRLPERQRLTQARANETRVERALRPLHEAFVAQAQATPGAPAVIAGERTLSYGELAARAATVARELLDAGVVPGDLVGITMERGAEQVVAVMAILFAGAAYLPVDTTHPPLRRNELLERAGVNVVLTQRLSLVSELSQTLRPVVVSLDADVVTQASEPLVATPGGADALAYVIFTSGSTGTPKGVMIKHGAAWNTVADIHERFGVGPADRVLGVAQLGFDLSVWDIFGPLSAGGALVVPDEARRSDPSHWARLIERHSVTLWNSVPAQMQMLLELLVSEETLTLPSLRLAMLSGDTIPISLPRELCARLPGCVQVSLGGATEASIWSIFHPIGALEPGATRVPYGRPLSNQTFHVLDAALRPRPDRVPGELYIGGLGVAAGYLGDPTLTAARFITHPDSGERLYRTGDFGRYGEDGSIEFLGREDLQIKIRGHRIEIGEIEAVLASHPAVSTASVLVFGEDVMHRGLAAFCKVEMLPDADGRSGVMPRGQASELAVLSARVVHGNEAAIATARAGEEASRAAARRIDVDGLLGFGRAADEVCLMAMARTLRENGLFAAGAPSSPRPGHSFADIAAACRVEPRHERLLRRWLSALVSEGWLELDPQLGVYTSLREVDPDQAARAQERLARAQGKLDYGPELLGYLRDNLSHLPSLLRGETDPLTLLFPKGQLGTARAAYQDNLMSRYLNRVATAVVCSLAERKEQKPLRILEVGAGVGGTGASLIEALASQNLSAEYLFSDVSQFFLNEAKQRFEEHRWVRYGVFDLNEDYRRQGLAPNSFDLIVSANVLHNAKDAPRALAALSELLVPGGALLFIEATRENYPLLVSMEFQEGLGGFVDLRAETGQTFLRREQWQALLDTAGARTELCLPAANDPLSGAGQHIFFARMKADRAPVEREDILDHLAAHLPEYMIPSRLELVDQLPLSTNGKVDRGALKAWLHAGRAQEVEIDADAEPRDDLERRVAGLFAELLGLPRVGRDSELYALGGDSLLVAQLVGRMRERLPEASSVDWDSLLRAVVRKPTVAGVAEYLRAPESPGGAGSQGGPRSPLVALRGRTDTKSTATVLVHDGSGTLAPYRAMLKRMRADTVLGLNVVEAAPYLELDPLHLIDQLAADYTRALLTEERESYRIVGYCMGGLLATEISRHLLEAGARVDKLTVISCYKIPYYIQDDLLFEYAFARVMGASPAALGYPDDDVVMGRAFKSTLAETPGVLPEGRFAQLDGEVGHKFAALAEREPAERMAAIGRALVGANALPADQMEAVYRFFRHSVMGVTMHMPEVYAGDITFVQDSGSVDFLPGLREAMNDYWSNLCLGELTIREVSGTHFTCMEEPNVAAVAGATEDEEAGS